MVKIMVMKVLKNKIDIRHSRKILNQLGLSQIESKFKKIIRRCGLLKDISVGDYVKSWDVLQTYNFLNEKIKKNDLVLDFGCYASEILIALYKSDYRNLIGVDLSEKLNKMPFQSSIKYLQKDFMNTDLPSNSVNAITSISVIEHGFKPELLLQEVSRLLVNGGFFIASFDYWPYKINTDDTKFFGLNWNIFSKLEIQNFIEVFKRRYFDFKKFSD